MSVILKKETCFSSMSFLFICLLISLKSFSQTEEPVKPAEMIIYVELEEPAEFPGGKDALKRYLKENIRYPERAVKEKIQGKCYLQFVVLNDGSISNIQVKKGVKNCPECDAEAIRVLKSMPAWEPGVLMEKWVNSVFSMPISFKL